MKKINFCIRSCNFWEKGREKKDTVDNLDIDHNDIPSDEGGIEFKNLETACEQGKGSKRQLSLDKLCMFLYI